MSKRNVAYIKPEEPNFLKRIKEEIGYKEGPSVDTKRELLPPPSEDDLEDAEDEKPTVVVLKSGDLTEDEARKLEEQIEKEKAEAPADLNQRVIFQRPVKNQENSTSESTSSSKKTFVDVTEPKKSNTSKIDRNNVTTNVSNKSSTTQNKSKRKEKKLVLSFNDDEDVE